MDSNQTGFVRVYGKGNPDQPFVVAELTGTVVWRDQCETLLCDAGVLGAFAEAAISAVLLNAAKLPLVSTELLDAVEETWLPRLAPFGIKRVAALIPYAVFVGPLKSLFENVEGRSLSGPVIIRFFGGDEPGLAEAVGWLTELVAGSAPRESL